MSIDDIEAEALKLDPKERARLAGRLLESLEMLSREENDRLWLDEAQRRERRWDEMDGAGLPADEVLPNARKRLD
jgi:Putative addiction module component